MQPRGSLHFHRVTTSPKSRTTFSEGLSPVSLEQSDMVVREGIQSAGLPGHHEDTTYQAPSDGVVQIHKGDIVIAIVGPSGSGKSEFINTVAGRQVAPTGADLNSCTEEVRAYKCKHPVDDRYVTLVDTPDSDRTDYIVLDDVTKWLHETYMQKILLSGVLQLHNIAEKRMRGPQLRGLATLRELCGAEAKGNLVMLTTFWDLVDVEVAAAREAELTEKLRKDFLDDGASVRRLQSRTQDCTWDVIDLFKIGARLTPKPLRILIEMGDNNKQFYQTSVFQFLLKYWTNYLDSIWGAGQPCTPSPMQERAREQTEKLVGAIPKDRLAEYGPKRRHPWFVLDSAKQSPFTPSLMVEKLGYGGLALPTDDTEWKWDAKAWAEAVKNTMGESDSRMICAMPGNYSASAMTDYYTARHDLMASSGAPSSTSSSSSNRAVISAQSTHYSIYDNGAINIASMLTKSISSKSTSRTKSGLVLPWSTEEGNYNPVAEELAQLSGISFTTSDSSATTDYGSVFFYREL
ncbi:hypothetical protein D9619_000391 [Psilocybe cf. subviscida]|uniref:G domain-containing protein n=1 Tax=Psilocybe cf. subviscida TaxID=2480587 RepID=A0A8H5BDC1_9AGAR|nr:hypothetical protein D9619_000391 [Psilocybe cf. subviscida]